MTRILLLTERFHPDLGGVSISAQRTYKSLQQLGVRVNVVVWSRQLKAGKLVREGNIYRLGLDRNWDSTMIRTLNLLESLQEKFDYDAVWGHYLFPAGFLAVWFGKSQGIESIVSARGNDTDRGVFPPGDFARLRWTLENASIVTAVSADLAKKIYLICNRDNISILKNAVDTNIFSKTLTEDRRQELKRNLGINSNEFVLGFSGELRAKKGQDFLLKALAEVREKISACLLIIGDVRPDDTKQQIENCAGIIVTRHLTVPKEIATHLQLCDLFLLPSVWEGLPNALLEAMACGCCCLASDAGGIPEIIEHGVNGFLLSRNNLQYLSSAILEFFELDSTTKNSISLSARDRIMAEFSLEQERERLQQVLLLINN